MRGAVHLLNVRMGYVFASRITMEMDILAHVSYTFLFSLLQTRELVLENKSVL